MDCIFCKIAAGQIPSKKIYEDDDILAFHDINPQAPIHALIIPKKHIDSLDDVDGSNISALACVFEKIPHIARSLGITQGYRVISNCGEHGCQSVKHLHFHLLAGTKLSERMN